MVLKILTSGLILAWGFLFLFAAAWDFLDRPRLLLGVGFVLAMLIWTWVKYLHHVLFLAVWGFGLAIGAVYMFSFSNEPIFRILEIITTSLLFIALFKHLKRA